MTNSYSTQMRSMQLRFKAAKKSRRFLPGQILDSKISAYEFADQIGVARPRTYATGVGIEHLPLNFPCVIKPVSEDEARGVFLCFSPTEIFEVKNARRLTSVTQMRERVEQLAADRDVRVNLWMSEELVLRSPNGPMAKDIKFYTFYGDAPLALETQRDPTRLRCWYGADLQVIKTGKYHNESFEGTGADPQLKLMAEEISLLIPSPFIRVDLLQTDAGALLGELTPIPGKFHKFSERIDRWLGEKFAAAQERLTNDLNAGKTFSAFDVTAAKFGHQWQHV